MHSHIRIRAPAKEAYTTVSLQKLINNLCANSPTLAVVGPVAATSVTVVATQPLEGQACLAACRVCFAVEQEGGAEVVLRITMEPFACRASPLKLELPPRAHARFNAGEAVHLSECLEEGEGLRVVVAPELRGGTLLTLYKDFPVVDHATHSIQADVTDRADELSQARRFETYQSALRRALHPLQRPFVPRSDAPATAWGLLRLDCDGSVEDDSAACEDSWACFLRPWEDLLSCAEFVDLADVRPALRPSVVAITDQVRSGLAAACSDVWPTAQVLSSDSAVDVPASHSFILLERASRIVVDVAPDVASPLAALPKARPVVAVSSAATCAAIPKTATKTAARGKRAGKATAAS